MKAILILLVGFFLSLNLFGQPKFEAPLGLTFGSDIETVKSILNSRGGTFDRIEIRIVQNLYYKDIMLGTLNFYSSLFSFVDNKLCVAYLDFLPPNNDEILGYYNLICGIITDKYGKGEINNNFQGYVSKEGLILGLERGNVKMQTWWFDFLNNEGVIFVAIESDKGVLSVKLGYQQSALYKEANRKIGADF